MFKTLEEARAYLPPQEVDCIVYHNNCADGVTSAFVGYLFNRHKGAAITYIPSYYGNTFSVEQYPGKNILIVDFSLEPWQLAALEAAGKKVLVLDHHKKALDMLKDYPHAYFEMERSGAGLAWEYYYSTLPPPRFVSLVQDRDLWKFSLPGCEAFHAGFWEHLGKQGFKNAFNFQSIIPYLQGTNVNTCIEHGAVLVAQQKIRLAAAREKASLRSYTLDGTVHKLWLFHALTQQNWEDRSEIAHDLLHHSPADFAAVSKVGPDNNFILSLRSEGTFDVNRIAVSLNPSSGGHVAAAAASVTTPPDILFPALPPQPMVEANDDKVVHVSKKMRMTN